MIFNLYKRVLHLSQVASQVKHELRAQVCNLRQRLLNIGIVQPHYFRLGQQSLKDLFTSLWISTCTKQDTVKSEPLWVQPTTASSNFFGSADSHHSFLCFRLIQTELLNKRLGSVA